MKVMRIAFIGRIFFRVWFWKSLEGIGDKNLAILNSVGSEDGAHEDRRTSSPDACFDQISGYSLAQYGLDAILQVIQTFQPDHRIGIYRPYIPFRSLAFRDVAYFDKLQFSFFQELRNGGNQKSFGRPTPVIEYCDRYWWFRPQRK